MYSSNRCLIDNWSLEYAGYLLNGEFERNYFTDEEFIKSLGGLSNYINAILLYDEAKFVANGLQTHWYRFDWFAKNTRLYVNPFIPKGSYIDWNEVLDSPDFGAKNYLLTSKYLDADLFISPERASHITRNGSPKVDRNFITTLEKIDEKIKFEKEELWDDRIKVGIEQNYVFPSLTSYVLSKASNVNDLLTVIMQLKDSGEMDKIKEEINQLSETTKGALKLQREVEGVVKRFFLNGKPADKPVTVSLDILFLSISKSFSLEVFQRERYLTFLKDVMACRAEAYRLKKDIERIFKRQINF